MRRASPRSICRANPSSAASNPGASTSVGTSPRERARVLRRVRSTRRRSARARSAARPFVVAEHFGQRLGLQGQPGQLLAHVVVQFLADPPVLFLGQRQQPILKRLALDHPAELHADAGHRFQHLCPRLDGLFGEELQDPHDPIFDHHRKGGRRGQSQVLGQFDSPCAQLGPNLRAPLRLAAVEDRAGKALAPSERRLKRQFAERLESLGVGRVPGVGRQEQVGIVGGREVGVAEVPAVVLGNPPQAILQSLLDVLSTVGHRSNVAEHLQRRGPLGGLAAPAFPSASPGRPRPVCASDVEVDTDHPLGPTALIPVQAADAAEPAQLAIASPHAELMVEIGAVLDHLRNQLLQPWQIVGMHVLEEKVHIDGPTCGR